MIEIESKTGTVAKPPYSLYMMLVDPRNIVNMLPQDKREGITVEYDSIRGTVQGFNVGIKYIERRPYSLLRLEDDGAPFHFVISLNFESNGNPMETLFSINVSADLNFMMKTLLGGKIKDALDKIVDALVDASHGKMPEGFDSSSNPFS